MANDQPIPDVEFFFFKEFAVSTLPFASVEIFLKPRRLGIHHRYKRPDAWAGDSPFAGLQAIASGVEIGQPVFSSCGRRAQLEFNLHLTVYLHRCLKVRIGDRCARQQAQIDGRFLPGSQL